MGKKMTPEELETLKKLQEQDEKEFYEDEDDFDFEEEDDDLF